MSKGLLTETTSKSLVVSVGALARMKTQSMLPSPEKLLVLYSNTLEIKKVFTQLFSKELQLADW